MTKAVLLAKLAARSRPVKTAYDVARENGYTGTVDQWLASLRGPRGVQGERGAEGIGKQGEVGPRGPQGPKGDIGPMPKHEWRGTELRFEMEPGQWGKFVDLKGDKGDAGGGIAFGGTNGAVIVQQQEGNSYMPVGF